MPRFRLRTLLIFLGIAPPLLAAAWSSKHASFLAGLILFNLLAVSYFAAIDTALKWFAGLVDDDRGPT